MRHDHDADERGLDSIGDGVARDNRIASPDCDRVLHHTVPGSGADRLVRRAVRESFAAPPTVITRAVKRGHLCPGGDRLPEHRPEFCEAGDQPRVGGVGRGGALTATVVITARPVSIKNSWGTRDQDGACRAWATASATAPWNGSR
jgi:hypothetical protein